MVLDQTSPAERLARIELLIEQYRIAKQQRLLQRAIGLWRKAEARQQFDVETPPHWVH
jgi:hypothetical protein